jgi:hypothetical protein
VVRGGGSGSIFGCQPPGAEKADRRLEEIVVVDVVVMPNEQKHGAFLFQESEDDPIMDLHSERPGSEALRMQL